ncbi:MAG: GlsB/YeaQ/YmgE family stress response membrane protein [Dehalococcoidia bacterium]|nr:GlsB/YeaQ/YmgE family stress response membrane protein [Dehalococcoidia bacterium]
MLLLLLLIFLAIVSLYVTIAIIGTILILLPWVVIGLLTGMIASAVTSQRHTFWENVGIGLVGSVIGGLLYETLTHQGTDGPFSPTRIGFSIVGAILFLIAVNALPKRY